MDLAGLRDKLKERFEERDQERLTIPAAAIGEWASIQSLVKEACASETLTITDIKAFPPDTVEGGIVYRGKATLFPWAPPPDLDPLPVQSTLAVTATFTVDAAQVPQLVIRAEPQALSSWHLSDSLDGLWETSLTAVTFEAASLYLASAPGDDDRYPGTLPRGGAFLGTIAPAGALSRTGQLLAAASARTVAGAIEIDGAGQPTFDLRPIGMRNQSLGGLPYGFGARLRGWTKTFDDDGSKTEWSFAVAEVVALLQPPGKVSPLELRMPLLPEGGTLALSLSGGGQSLSGWTAISRIGGVTDIQQVIPKEVPAAGEVVLEGLDLSLDLGAGDVAPSRALAVLDVALHTGSWPVLPNGILTLDTLGTQLTVSFLEAEPSVAAILYGSFDFVEAMSLKAWISVPDLGLGVALEDELPVDLGEVMGRFIDKLTGISFRPPLNMALADFELGASLRTGEFSVRGDVLTAWEVPLDPTGTLKLARLKFEGISFLFAYGGGAVQVELNARMSIASAKFFVSASTPGGENAGWTLEAGTPPQNRISVLDLMKELMFGEQPVPGVDYGVPTIELTAVRMSVSLDSENNAHQFKAMAAAEANWKPSVLGTTLQLAVSLWVEGVKPTTALGLVPADAEWQIEGEVGGSLVLYGLAISVGYWFAEENSTLTFGIWYGNRGIEATVSKQLKDPNNPKLGKDTILTVRLGDLSLGEILEYLISLAVPGESRRLPAPWDLLYQFNFRDLSLVANLTSKDVEVQYTRELNLGFAKFTKLGLLYNRVNGEGRVYLRLYGEFLGQKFGEGGNEEPLSWDVVNEEAPAVSGKGPAFLDLTYVGIGQHLALSTPDSELTTVEKAITALKASMKPVSGEGNPLTDPAAATLRYDGGGKWLFGLEATLMDTVYLAGVFYDPHLYGALIKLKGERAGSLAGLRFELIYRRITAEIGEFSVDLTIPDSYRNWEFGEVSVTLGLIHLDIYTNGNFRIDAGFPHEGDFSSSFSVEVFPFLGRGGFYFAYLTGATSSRVPKADNGVFDPVIEAGVGLSVGVGKDFHKGPLSAGLTLEVFGIFEGVFAPFSPYDKALPKETYFWFQGTAGIVGRLYGSVDFVVLKVSVSIVARAVATIVIEAHEPTQIDLRLEVEAEGRIKIVFITIHFSFSLTIEESITIGSHTSAPWHLPPPQPHLEAPPPMTLWRENPHGAPVPVSSQPPLRRQGSQHRPRPVGRIRQARLRSPALRRDPALRAGRAREALLAKGSGQATGGWDPLAVYGESTPQTIRANIVPLITIADPATVHPPRPAGANERQAVLALAGENTVATGARTAAEVAEPSHGHLHLTDAGELAAVPRMIDAFLRWAALAGAAVSHAQPISAIQLQDLLDDLADDEFRANTFAYENLAGFLAKSLHLEVVGYPPSGEPGATSGSFFPMVPEVSTETKLGTSTTKWSFATEPPVGGTYERNLGAYFEQLATEATANAANDPLGPTEAKTEAEPAAVPASQSLSKLLFGDYFALLTRAALQGAIDLLAAYPYDYDAKGRKSLADIAASFHPAARESGLAAASVAVTATSVAQDNREVALASGTQFAVRELPYQVRAGQSLNAIAAAAPAAASTSAPTAVKVGEANRTVEGLLRAGETLKIPAHDCTRMENDSDAFLKALFEVRATGVEGVEGVSAEILDWYSQALSLLNPEVVWSEIPEGQKVKVPSGYRDSTAAAAEYPIHPRDTLPRIAAAFARFELQGGKYEPSPAGGSYEVEQLSREIVSTDTFGIVAEDFPGLLLGDLLTANAATPMLTPLATLTLPEYTARIGEEQTLAKLAQAFDLDIPGLVFLLEGVAGLFAAKSKLTIRDVPARPLDTLIEDLLASGQANAVATQLSRFLMHGMRMPAPEDQGFLSLSRDEVLEGAFKGKLYSLYELNGQQTRWPDTTQPIEIALGKSASATWLTFVESTVGKDGKLELGNTVETLLLKIDQTRFGAQIPSTELKLEAEKPQPMGLFETRPVHHNLQAHIHWQAADRPQLPAGGNAAEPGEPTLWPFTSELLRVAAGSGVETPAYGLSSLPLEAPPGTEGAALKSYAWAVRVPVSLQRVAAEPLPGAEARAGAPAATRRWLEGVYLVNGADHDGADRLLELWDHLQGAEDAERGTRLFLLYPPNVTEPNPGGLASDALAPHETYLLKTNLSTEAREQAAVGMAAAGTPVPTDVVYSASISPPLGPPTEFVNFLWEASVVKPGGFYLHYGEKGGAGLPDSVFDDTGHGTIDLVCVLHSQAGGQTSGGPLRPFNNAAVVNDNLDAADTQVYAEQTAAGGPTVQVPSLPAGNVGFTMLRKEPAETDLGGRLYNLFGFQLAEKAPFLGSNEALPAGPTPAPAPNSGKWLYHQVFNAARRAATDYRMPQNCPALPPSAEDPYAGIGQSAFASISFAAHDVLGSRAQATDAPEALSIPFRYADRVIGVSEWPGLVASYLVTAPGPYLEVALTPQPGSYAPGPGAGTAPALRAAAAAAVRYRQAFYQLSRPGIDATLATTLEPGASLPLSKARLLTFVAGSFVFTDQLAKLTPVLYEVPSGKTLAGVASAFSVTATDLLEANQDLLATDVFAADLVVPSFARVPRGGTLGEIVPAGQTVVELLERGKNEAAPVAAGTSLPVPVRTFSPQADKTLAEMAAEAGCNPGDIGAANADLAGLIADSLTIAIEGVQVVTSGSTFTSLAAGFKELGVTVSAADVAAAAAEIEGIFKAGGPPFEVERWNVPAGYTLQRLIAEKFGGDRQQFANADAQVAGLVVEGSRLLVGEATEPAMRNVTLREYAVRKKLTLAELAAFDPTATLTPTVSPIPKLLVPALVEAGPLEAVPYAVASGQTLSGIAGLFGTDVDDLGKENQDLPGVFVPGQEVQPSGFGAVTTGAEDSIASLRLKFPASSRPELVQLLAAIAERPLLREGAVLICPPPTVPAGAQDSSLKGMASRFGLRDPRLFARINAGIDGLLDPGASVTVEGVSLTVGAHGTLASLYARAREKGMAMGFEAMVGAIEGLLLLKPGAKFLLPPPAVSAGAALGSNPALSEAITPLEAAVTISRPAAEIDPSLSGAAEIREAKTQVPPLTTPAAPGQPVSYVPFATQLAAAYDQRLRVASGPQSGAEATRRLYAVRFELPSTAAKAIEQVKVEEAAQAKYFALPPLCNELVSRPADVRTYVSGADEPLSQAERRVFQSVDVEVWAEEALAAIDLALSAAYAPGAFTVTRSDDVSEKFDQLVDAKRRLAEKISAGLAGVLIPEAGDRASAVEALRQRLDVSLLDGFATDAVVQLPTAVKASFGDGDGHRLAGKALLKDLELSKGTTLGWLAGQFQVDVAAIARLLGATPNLLATGTKVEAGGHSWEIKAHQTLADGLAPLGLDSLDRLASALATWKPLFRNGASIAIDGYATATRAEQTLADAAERLDSPVAEVAVANQKLAGLLAVGTTIYLHGIPHEVTAATSSLAAMAASLPLGVEVLAEEIAEQGVLAAGKELRAVRWIPSHSLSPGKIDLGVESGNLNLLLGVEQRAQYRRLLLNLDYRLTGLEYGIRQVRPDSAYERSDWLQFVTPLDGDPPTKAEIKTHVGQLEVPVPLRAYPTPPRLVSHAAGESFSDEEVVGAAPLAEQLRKAKAWDYQALFEVEEAAQDLVYLDVGFNYGTQLLAQDEVADDPFAALAEFAGNWPAIGADLRNLLLPREQLEDAKLKAAKSAVAALAAIAKKIADNWGPVLPSADIAAGDGEATKYEFRLESRVGSGPNGPVMEAVVLTSRVSPPVWGPDGKYPQLSYLSDEGKLVPLKASAGAGEIRYEFSEKDVPAFKRRTYALAYRELDPVANQNARTSIWLTRNERLVEGGKTNPRFVYGTPETHFHDPIAPSILRGPVLSLGKGDKAGLEGATRSLFADLLGAVTDSTWEKIAVSYGYRVASPSGGSDPEEDLVLFTPVVFRPPFTYATTVPEEIREAVEAWLAANPPPAGQEGIISFDLTLFSSEEHGKRPLAELKRLDYRLTA